MKRALIGSAFLVLCLPGIARPQAAVSPQKKQLIDKLITVTGADKNVGVIFDAFMNAYIMMMPPFDESSFKVAQSGPPEFRRELIALANRTMKTIASRTKERVLQDNGIRTEQLAIVTKIWNDVLNEDDLKELLTFFESPVGKKMIQLGPAVATETARRSPEILGPSISRIYDKVEREEFEKIHDEVMQLERKYKIGKNPG